MPYLSVFLNARAHGTQHGGAEIDICTKCKTVWFDNDEAFASSRGKPQETGVITTLPNEFSAEMVASLLGLPTEIHETGKQRFNMGVAALVLIITACSILAFKDLPMAVSQFGFFPHIAFEGEYRRWISSAFIHGDVWHLIGNMYLFWILGDNVEEELGIDAFLLFFLFSVLAGNFLTVYTNPHSNIPHIGASGGILGIFTFYCAKFPRSKIALGLPLIGPILMIMLRSIGFKSAGIRIALRARTVFVIYGITQILGFFSQRSGEAVGVSYSSHVGGLVMGLVFALLFSNPRGAKA